MKHETILIYGIASWEKILLQQTLKNISYSFKRTHATHYYLSLTHLPALRRFFNCLIYWHWHTRVLVLCAQTLYRATSTQEKNHIKSISVPANFGKKITLRTYHKWLEKYNSIETRTNFKYYKMLKYKLSTKIIISS